jgi:hypothetical protein
MDAKKDATAAHQQAYHGWLSPWFPSDESKLTQ